MLAPELEVLVELSLKAPLPKRICLAKEVEQYLTRDLGLTLTPMQSATLGCPERVDLIEFAHTPHFGHLGFARMLFVALSRCSVDAVPSIRSELGSAVTGVLLFCLNDHVASNILPNIRHIPMLRGGRLLATPPSLGVKSSDSARPLTFVPSPARESVLKAAMLVKDTLAFEASRGPKSLRRLATKEIGPLFEWLADQAVRVEDFSSWVVRCWMLWMAEIRPDIAVWALPSRRLTSILPEATQRCIDETARIARIQDDWALAEGNWPTWSQMRQAGPGYFPFHALCHVCRKIVSDPTDHCHPVELAPKVIARQPIADQLVLKLRVAGGPRGYWPVATEIGQLLRSPETERLQVTGQVGLRLPWGEEPCPSVLRVACQLPVSDWYQQFVQTDPAANVVLNWPLKELSNVD